MFGIGNYKKTLRKQNNGEKKEWQHNRIESDTERKLYWEILTSKPIKAWDHEVPIYAAFFFQGNSYIPLWV